MTAAYTLNKVCEWTKENIADRITCKKPKNYDDENYEYTLVHPKVVRQDYGRSEDIVENVPSILVSLGSVQSDTPNNKYTYEFSLTFICWSSGVHRQDQFIPVKDKELTYENPSVNTYVANESVSDDLINFIDFANSAFWNFNVENTKMDDQVLFWNIVDDPEVRASDYRICSTTFTVTEPMAKVIPSDSDTDEIKEQKEASKNSIDALL